MTLDEIHAGMRAMQVRESWDLVDFGSSKSALFIVVPVTEEQLAWLATWEKRVQLNLPYFAITQQLDAGEVRVLVQDFHILYQRIESYFSALGNVVGDIIARIVANQPEDVRLDPSDLRAAVIGEPERKVAEPLSQIFQRTDAEIFSEYKSKSGSTVYVVTPRDEDQAFRLTELRYKLTKPFMESLRDSLWLGYVQVCGINDVFVVEVTDNGHTKVHPFNLFYRDNKNECNKLLSFGVKALEAGFRIPMLVDEILG